MIHLEKLTKTWNLAGSPALDSISVDIHPGRITGLVGPDGAGKTTLLRILAGLLPPSEGSAAVFGFDATRQTDDIKPFLGYMPQKFGLYEDLTVMENLELYAKLRGLPKSERTKKLEELLQFTSLTKFTGRLARRLSGGMKQKLGLACALITTPRLLLLDEPGVGVDPISRRELWRMVGVDLHAQRSDTLCEQVAGFGVSLCDIIYLEVLTALPIIVGAGAAHKRILTWK